MAKKIFFREGTPELPSPCRLTVGDRDIITMPAVDVGRIDMDRVRSLAVLFLSAVLVGYSGSAGAQSEKRVALVIGNSAYRNTEPLNNPKNDATDIAKVLKRLGFQTILETDLNKIGMDDAFRRFAKLTRDADVALFFYAGHATRSAG